MSNRVAFLLSLVLAAAVSGCEGDKDDEHLCTLIGCLPSKYELTKKDWEPGEYEVDVAYDIQGEIALRCMFQVGAEPDGEDAGVEPFIECTKVHGSSTGEIWTLNDKLTLELFDAPDKFSITLRHAGKTLLDDTITPDYTTRQLNGPGCGECRSTEQSIVVP